METSLDFWCRIPLFGARGTFGAKPALVGFQGRGCAEVVQLDCCYPFRLEALLFQWPSIRRCASRTMVEHKTPESNKSIVECVLAFLLTLGFQLLHKTTWRGGGCLTRHSHYARVRLGRLTIW